MIRINWSEVEAAKNRLSRDGATGSFQMVIIILYHSKSSADRKQIKLGELEASLFAIASDQDVKAVFLYDIEMKKPYLKCEAIEHANVLETVPLSGHPGVLLEFDNMSPQGRDVWVDITLAELQHYVRINDDNE